METGSVEPGGLRAAKYVLYGEMARYLTRGQSLVIYQHLNRSSRALRQVYRRQRDIYEHFHMRSLAMRYHRGSPRAFLIIPQRRHRDYFMSRIRLMTGGPWAGHFTMIG